MFNSTSKREIYFREAHFRDFRRQWRKALMDERWAWRSRLAAIEEVEGA